ncbi:MAG: tyrosine-type recombinase/integrase [Rhodanobacteraceae bacterium]
MSAPPTYLKRRKRGWYVQLSVPRKLQAAVGAKVLTRSLGTRDETEALRLRHKVIAELQQHIADAAHEGPQEITPERILETARDARAAIEAGEAVLEELEPGFDVMVDDYLETEARKRGRDEEGHPNLSPQEVRTIQRAHRTIAGNAALTLGHQAQRYLSQMETSELRRQTVYDKRRHLEAFLDWIDPDTECKRVTKARAGAYVDEVVMPREVAVQTKRLAINTVRQFFDWLEARGLVNANPFSRAGALLRESRRGGEQARRPWTDVELLTMLRYVPQGDPLWALTALGAYTGARREDLCDLKVDSVDDGVLQVREGKTAAAVRRVPIHPVIRPLVRQLADTSKDGYLLPGLLTGGKDDKRGHYIGKRFSYALRRAGITDKRVVFHSFRNSVLTQMEAAGVELSLRQQIVGHERGTITERTYTANAADRRRAEAIAHVSYGAKVDKLVQEVGRTFKIARVSRRRHQGRASGASGHRLMQRIVV